MTRVIDRKYHNRPEFPLEIIEVIIDHIEWRDRTGSVPSFDSPIYERWLCHSLSPDTIKALGACSLVAKAWVPRCRSRLFRCIDVKLSRKHYRRRVALIQLLKSPLSTIPRWVQSIGIIDSPELDDLLLRRESWFSQLRGLWTRPRCIRSKQDMLRRLDTGFSGIETFIVFHVSFDSVPQFHCFEKCQHLQMEQCSIPDFSAFAKGLSACSSLEQLMLSSNMLKSLGIDSLSSSSLSSLPPPPSTLRHLRLFNSFSDMMLRWFLSDGKSIRQLHSLDIAIVRTDPHLLSQLLRLVGPSLKNLDISFFHSVLTLALEQGTSEVEDFCENLDLSANTGLRALTLDMHAIGFVYPGDTKRQFLTYVPRILAAIPSTSMEEVTLNFGRLFDDIPLELIDWERISDVLCRDNYNNLQKVSVSVGSIDRDPFTLRTLILERLPRLESRNVLVINH